MGTRSLTVFKGYEGEICRMYRQFDGYPSVHGKELCKILKGGIMVNGLPLGSEQKLFNGMGCLAAQVVAALKTEPGGFYLYPPGTDDVGEEWVYTITAEIDQEPHVHIYDVRGKEVYFAGPASEFEPNE